MSLVSIKSLEEKPCDSLTIYLANQLLKCLLSEDQSVECAVLL